LHFRFLGVLQGNWNFALQEIKLIFGLEIARRRPSTTQLKTLLRRICQRVPLSPSLGIKVVPSLVENATDIERTIEAFARTPNGGLLLPPDTHTQIHRDLIIALAAQHSLPTVAWLRAFVAAGGLMSYGVDFVDMNRQAASYVDRILRGDKPSDLPVQAATKFQTIVNLKTAKALGLTVAPGLLVAADEVIE
jgi:putative tryptophan/tyrosine transport system substrate-binding protein